MHRHPLAVLIVVMVLSVAFAGCTEKNEADDDPGDNEPTGTPDASPTTNTRGSRELVAGSKPIWFLGLQWTYEVDNVRAGVKGDLVLAIVAEDDEVWQLAPANGSDEEVVLWSLFAHLPPMGPVQKDTFAPHVHNAPLSWFDFPLRDGKTWTETDHHGAEVQYATTVLETTLFDGRSVPAYEVVAKRDGVTWLRYVYTAEVGFFVEASLDGDSDGVFDLTARLTDARTGSLHRTTPTFEPVEVARLNDIGSGSILEPATSYTVPGGATDLYIFFVLGGGPGRYTGSITLPSGAVKSFNFTNTNETPMSVVRGARYDAQAGDGNIGSVILGEGFVRAEVFTVHRNGP